MNISKFVSNKFYGQKDIKKFEDCSKLISMGAVGSSSHNYSKHPKANLSQYDKCDVVGISINGNRKNRVSIESFVDELNLAIDS
ncbi:MAG: hypothetical protein U9P50_02675, partial [Patescibacteria group bacterium]|nr:hypothetical protein [Patescibacteria group bacterium]